MESIRNFLNRLLPKGSAMRHVSILAGGTTIAQGLNVAIMPVLSRVYSPADFGVMAVFVSVTAILTELSGFRYYFAIPLPKHERYAKALVVLSFFLQAVFVVVISLVLLVIGKPLLTKISMDSLIPYRFLIPVGVAGMGAYITLTQWAIREKLFQTIARTKVTQSISGAVAMVSLGFLGFRPLGLLIGKIIGQAGGITTLARSIFKKKGLPKPPLEDIKRVALRYRKFPMYSTWSGMLITLGIRITPIILVSLFDPRVAGLFAMAESLLHVPAVFIGQSISQVFLQRASEAKHQGLLKYLFRKAAIILMRIGFFPIILISFFAPFFLGIILGERWQAAGQFAQIIAPWVAINFVFSPLSSVFFVLERQRIGFLFEVFHMPLKLLSLFVGSKIGGAWHAVLFLSITNSFVYFLKLGYLYSTTGNDWISCIGDCVQEISLVVLLCILPAISLKMSWGPIGLGIMIFFSIALYLKKLHSLLIQKENLFPA